MVKMRIRPRLGWQNSVRESAVKAEARFFGGCLNTWPKDIALSNRLDFRI